MSLWLIMLGGKTFMILSYVQPMRRHTIIHNMNYSGEVDLSILSDMICI